MKKFSNVLTLAFLSSNVFAHTLKPVHCDAMMCRADEEPKEGYIDLEFEPFQAKVQMPGEAEQIVKNPVEIQEFSKPDLNNEGWFPFLLAALSVDSNEVDHITLFKFMDNYSRSIMFLSFFDKLNNKLGDGGFINLQALFLCKNSDPVTASESSGDVPVQ